MDWYLGGGDLDFFWPEQLAALSWLPDVWGQDKGFGEPLLLRLWLDYPFRLLLKLLAGAGMSWFLIEKLVWLSVFVIAVWASYALAKHILGSKVYAWLSAVIYATNTYFLLIVTGGQLGVSWAYAFSPFVIYRCLRFRKNSLKDQVLNGMILALLITLDLRLAYLIFIVVVLMGYRSILSFGIAACLHLFWILPLVLVGSGASGAGEQFTNPGMLSFLSVADFSHALALLHPNWPENLFGKVYFLRAEFLVLPLVAACALLWPKKAILPFMVLSLSGAFLAKGVQEPFGQLFAWLFSHFPGFVMFRDPTKFYLFTAIGYSLLIPYVLSRIRYRWVAYTFLLFWMFTLRGLSFPSARLPEEYTALKDLLVADSVPSRTLWIPQKESFAFFSDTHPIIATDSAFVSDPQFESQIANMGIGYVIVPQDVHKRIFLDEYKYSPAMREALINRLRQTQLTELPEFGQVSVFKNANFQFESRVPEIVVLQQHYATIGLIISVLALFLSICFLLY